MSDEQFLTSNGVDLKSSLEFLENMKSYDSTLKEFINHSSDNIAKLVTYKISGDIENYSLISHHVKNDSRYLGFVRLTEIALTHEMQAKANNKKYIDEHFDEFISEINRVVEIGKSYLGDKINQTEENEKTETDVKESKGAVLVVDDSAMIRKFIKRAIDPSEYDIIVAGNGNEAIKIIEGEEKDRIRAIFLDLLMPECNGFDVLKYFSDHKLFDKYPISIITGADDKASIDKAFTYQIVDMLIKPFTEKDVRRILERTVSFK